MTEKYSLGNITAFRMDDALLDALLTRVFRYKDIVRKGFPYYHIADLPTHNYTKTRFIWLGDGIKYTLAVIPEDRDALLVKADGIRHIASGFWGVPTGGKIAVSDAEEWRADEPIPFIGAFDNARGTGGGWIILAKDGKKNAIVPSYSRSSLFFREWVDNIAPSGIATKVTNKGKTAAFNDDGWLLVDDVVSITSYNSMCFIKCPKVVDNIIIDKNGAIVLKGISNFTGLGEYAAIRRDKGAYEIIDSDGRRHFRCKFEKVAKLGMYRVGLMYQGQWYVFDRGLNRLSERGFHKVDRYVGNFVNEDCQEGFLMVSRDGKYNYLTENGNILLPFWCDKAEPFNYSKTADIERNGVKYIVYDCKNKRNGSCEMRTTRPNIRVREKRRYPSATMPPLSLYYGITYDAEEKSYKDGGLRLRGVTSRINVPIKKHLASESGGAFAKYSAAEYGKMLHGAIETIEADGTWTYDYKCCRERNMLGEETASKLVKKYTDIRKGFEGIYVKDEYPCRGNFGYMTLIDFVFADVNGGAILVEIKTNAEYPAEYLRIQMSIEKQFFITTNPHIKDVKTYCLWFPRGNLEASEIKEVSADMTEDEIREYLCERQV